jgi:hypothetical protein
MNRWRTSSLKGFRLTEKNFAMLQDPKEIHETACLETRLSSVIHSAELLHRRGEHRRIGWITFSKRGIREILDTPVPGVYLSEGQRWGEIRSDSIRVTATGSEAHPEK